VFVAAFLESCGSRSGPGCAASLLVAWIGTASLVGFAGALTRADTVRGACRGVRGHLHRGVAHLAVDG
jgi:hypothetical protein